ncbi:hypothetical protein NL676_018460 [Syzygium grande]|nr:hypothetical protein NL676_018460 [Syzygium grande]
MLSIPFGNYYYKGGTPIVEFLICAVIGCLLSTQQKSFKALPHTVHAATSLGNKTRTRNSREHQQAAQPKLGATISSPSHRLLSCSSGSLAFSPRDSNPSSKSPQGKIKWVFLFHFSFPPPQIILELGVVTEELSKASSEHRLPRSKKVVIFQSWI